ncbi:hypothetical protein CEN50_19525, partial [Fischerella thermalis CCMEE 5268]
FLAFLASWRFIIHPHFMQHRNFNLQLVIFFTIALPTLPTARLLENHAKNITKYTVLLLCRVILSG